MGGVWITGEYVGISDDAYTYLKNPEYIRLVQNNSNLALMPCSKTDDEALKVHGDTIALNFWHVWIPAQHCRLFKRGRHPGSVYKRAVGSDVYILLEDAHAT